MKKFLKIGSFVLVAFIIGAFVRTSFAGSLTPPGVPASTMYTLDGIYNRLIDNTTSQVEGSASFTTPGSVSATFHTLKQIYESIPTLDATKILTGTTYMGVAGTASAGQAGLPKTGQTDCWDASGTPISCTGTGQDGDYEKGLPTSGARFVDNTDSTISDNATGLMWKKCSEGQSDTDCSADSATGLDWTTALSTCEADTTAGHSDWRLPNRIELLSIVSLATVNPAIDTTFFPNTQSGFYWSSSTYQYPGFEVIAWGVDFNDGYSGADDKSNGYYVRCVR